MNLSIGAIVNIVDNKTSSITLLVGDNGVGKSHILNNLAKAFLIQGRTVIAIANTASDRFSQRRNKFFLLSHRTGRHYSTHAFKRALTSDKVDSLRNAKAISRALRYCNFDATIGIRIEFAHQRLPVRPRSGYEFQYASNGAEEAMLNWNDLLYSNSRISENHFDLLRALKTLRAIPGGISELWIDLEGLRFTDMEWLSAVEALRFESLLRKAGIVRKIGLVLQRNNDRIELDQISSGEASLLAMYAFISATIEQEVVVLVDEPENSLHPHWQKDYFSNLLDLFSLYQPKIIAATHSPIIVTGAQRESNTQILKVMSLNEIEVTNSYPNLEETLWRSFDTLPPANHFLSEQITGLLNQLNNNKVSLDDVNIRLKQYRDQSYDKKQIRFIEKIKELASEIANKAEEGGSSS